MSSDALTNARSLQALTKLGPVKMLAAYSAAHTGTVLLLKIDSLVACFDGRQMPTYFKCLLVHR